MHASGSGPVRAGRLRSRHRPPLLVSAVLAVAALVASAGAAQGAVTRSAYTVTEVAQSSTVQAGFGVYSWSNGATLRYSADPGGNLVRFDFPARPGPDPFVRGGTDLAGGALRVTSTAVAQTGGVVQDGLSCGFVPLAPPDEGAFRVEFFRTPARPRAVIVEVMGQDALLRLGAEERSGRLRAAGCGLMPALFSPRPIRSSGYDRRTAFVVRRAVFRRAAGPRPVHLVLRGVARSRLVAEPGVVGTLTVSTTVRLRLMGSR